MHAWDVKHTYHISKWRRVIVVVDEEEEEVVVVVVVSGFREDHPFFPLYQGELSSDIMSR